MRDVQSRDSGELSVLISLLVSIGMVVGTVVTVWLGMVVSEGVPEVIEQRSDIT